MQIENLRSLIALAAHQRVTDAAAVMHMSQPTLSRLLARVEEELGARLFERNAKGVRPNPYGEVALSAARDIVDRYDHLRRELADLLDPDSGVVRLAFLDSMATSLVPQILGDFRRDAPNVRVTLRQEPSHALLRDLESGLCELALVSPRPTGPHGWIPLQKQHLVLVVPQRHRLARRKRVRLAEVAGEQFVTVPSGYSFRTLFDELFAAAGVTPQLSFESEDLATVAGLVGAGLGVALLPDQMAGASTTVGIPLVAAGAVRVVGLTWRTDRIMAAPAARFLAFIRGQPYPHLSSI